AQEDVTGKHRHASEPSDTAPPGPGLDRWQKELKTLGGELVVHELLAVAMGPQHVPALHGGICQGFAPFGSNCVFEPTCRAHRLLCRQHQSRHGTANDTNRTTLLLLTAFS